MPKRNLVEGEGELRRIQPRLESLGCGRSKQRDELGTEGTYGANDLEVKIVFGDEGQGAVILEWTQWPFGVEGV